MVRIFTLLNMSLLMSLMFVMWPALAESNTVSERSPWPTNISYKLSYLEAPIGKMTLDIQQKNGLSIDARIEVAGLARLFSDFYNTMNLKIDGPEPDGYSRVFNTHYHRGDNNDRVMKLAYAADGSLTKAERENIHDMKRRDAISDDALASAYDPLSTMLAMRKHIHQAVAKGTQSFEQTMYDGKRLYHFDINIYGVRSFEWSGRDIEVRKIGLTHRYAGGLTAKERKRRGDYQFPEVVLYFTNDEKFLPVYGKQPWKFGAFKVTME